MAKLKGAEPEPSVPTRIGIDFGGVIRKDDGECHDKAFEIIQFITYKYGPSNTFIVSKANQAAQLKIINWLNEKSFFRQTSFLPSNVYFVADYVDKKHVVNQLSINVFIDDKIQNILQVIACPTIQKVIWFNNSQNNKYSANPNHKIQHINRELFGDRFRQLRDRLVITEHWNRIQKILSKVPNTQ